MNNTFWFHRRCLTLHGMGHLRGCPEYQTVTPCPWTKVSPMSVDRTATCRLTNRCSDPGPIKCSAAGGRAQRAPERWRARVLKGQRAVAELGR